MAQQLGNQPLMAPLQNIYIYTIYIKNEKNKETSCESGTESCIVYVYGCWHMLYFYADLFMAIFTAYFSAAAPSPNTHFQCQTQFPRQSPAQKK